MFLGIDIAKAKFDVALLTTAEERPKHKVFANNPAGFQQLGAWLHQQQAHQVHACLEATGSYGDAVARYLHAQGHRVSVVNPAAIHAFAKSRLSRAKTDKADASVIAYFCQRMQPTTWEPPAPEMSHLQTLTRRLEALRQMRTMEQNRSGRSADGSAPHTFVLDSVEATLTFLSEQIAACERAIRELVACHLQLARNVSLLTSIPGIGFETATVILAELGSVARFVDADAACAYAGLVPRLRESGSSVRSRACLSKLGNSRLRKALFFPALGGARFNPIIRAFRERLLSRGKSKMAVVGAVMRKLLRLAYGVLKGQRPFEASFASG
jgi:transposase